MGKGIFGDMFDFNGDGEMSAFERAAELQFLHEAVLADDAEDELSSAENDPFGSDYDF